MRLRLRLRLRLILRLAATTCEPGVGQLATIDFFHLGSPMHK
jgi:hypothetical protein